MSNFKDFIPKPDELVLQRAEILSSQLEAESVLGRVVRTYRMGMDVQTVDGERLFGTTDDSYRDPLRAPATGDWVLIGPYQDREYLLVTSLDLRFSALVRRDPADKAVPQVLASNVDVVACVHGADREVNKKRLWRFLAIAGGAGESVETVIVLTKADLPETDRAKELLEEATSGLKIISSSSADGTGLDVIKSHIGENETMVLLGESGSGKSSLINALVGEETLEVAEVRDIGNKGRHTTTHRELLALPSGGFALDTPGVRSVGMWPGSVDYATPFPDIVEATTRCRFADCSHRNEPGCGVRAGLESGELSQERVDACFELVDEENQIIKELEQKDWR